MKHVLEEMEGLSRINFVGHLLLEHTASGLVGVQVQCITHFLRLPIEDEFLDHLEDPPRGGHALPPEANPQSSNASVATGAPDDDATGAEPIPFADQGNPVMAQARLLSFLDSTFRVWATH